MCTAGILIWICLFCWPLNICGETLCNYRWRPRVRAAGSEENVSESLTSSIICADVFISPPPDNIRVDMSAYESRQRDLGMIYNVWYDASGQWYAPTAWISIIRSYDNNTGRFALTYYISCVCHIYGYYYILDNCTSRFGFHFLELSKLSTYTKPGRNERSTNCVAYHDL